MGFVLLLMAVLGGYLVWRRFAKNEIVKDDQGKGAVRMFGFFAVFLGVLCILSFSTIYVIRPPKGEKPTEEFWLWLIFLEIFYFWISYKCWEWVEDWALGKKND